MLAYNIVEKIFMLAYNSGMDKQGVENYEQIDMVGIF